MWVLALLPFLLVAALYSRLPDQVPMHWGVEGEINRWGSKNELWLIAALGPGMALLFQFLRHIFRFRFLFTYIINAGDYYKQRRHRSCCPVIP